VGNSNDSNSLVKKRKSGRSLQMADAFYLLEDVSRKHRYLHFLRARHRAGKEYSNVFLKLKHKFLIGQEGKKKKKKRNGMGWGTYSPA
jgi:hypothetical protein